MKYYNNLKDYAEKNNIDRRTAKKHRGKMITKIEVKWKKAYVSFNELFSFLHDWWKKDFESISKWFYEWDMIEEEDLKEIWS